MLALSFIGRRKCVSLHNRKSPDHSDRWNV